MPEITPRTPPALSNATQRTIDGKFGFRDGEIVNLVSGEIIPRDEPLFLLRARDTFSVGLLNHYRTMCNIECNDLHLKGIDQVMDKFAMFQLRHPERVKQPGKTRHLKLDAAAPPVAEGPAATTRHHCTFCGTEHHLYNEPCPDTELLRRNIDKARQIQAHQMKKAAAEPFTPNAVEGPEARAVARIDERLRNWLQSLDVLYQVERDELPEHTLTVIDEIGEHFNKVERQLDEARRKYDFLINDHPDDEHPPRYWENVEDGDRCIYCALESAEAANQELRRALQQIADYDDEFSDTTPRAIAAAALLGPQHGDSRS